MPEPKDKKLYEKVKKDSDKVFDEKTSVYKSSWIVREYKKRGGTYKGDEPTKDSGLKRWYKEKWVDLNRPDGKGSYKPCGRQNMKKKYPLCRPTVKVNSDTPKILSEIPKKKIEKIKKLKKENKAFQINGVEHFYLVIEDSPNIFF